MWHILESATSLPWFLLDKVFVGQQVKAAVFSSNVRLTMEEGKSGTSVHASFLRSTTFTTGMTVSGHFVFVFASIDAIYGV